MTRFPGDSVPTAKVQSDPVPTAKKKARRMTRFPGGTEAGIAFLSTASLTARPIETEKAVQRENVLLRLPVRTSEVAQVSPLEAHEPPSSRLSPDLPSKRLSLDVHYQSPWDTYRLVRGIGRSGKTKAASTKRIPTKMVVVKEIKSNPFSTAQAYRQQNLVDIVGVYKFQEQTFLVSEYAQVSLKQVIAVPLDLEEIDISTICGQVGTAQSWFGRR